MEPTTSAERALITEMDFAHILEMPTKKSGDSMN